MVESKRLTHNKIKDFRSSIYAKNRIQTEKLQDCMYGHWLLRVIYMIVALRERHPTKIFFFIILGTNPPTSGITWIKI